MPGRATFGVRRQEPGALADLSGADGGAAKLLDDGGDFAGGDTLRIHLGPGQLEGLLGADAFRQGAGIEVQIAPHLGARKVMGPTRLARVLGL